MAERSFAREVQDLKLGEGEEFRGEGILAITKALLQSGVSYVGGYQGAPISHLMDVLADAKDVLDELGVHFENSASEAAAAATLAASVHYPIRGAVTFKSPVGINVASDAIANLASGGVTGGTLIIIGEDYGEGSSIMQERSHPFAMKSQVWLLDPRPNLPTIVKAVEDGFELSEISHTPVMLEVRIRACHVHGRFTTKANKKPTFTLRQALENPRRDTNRVVLPPASYHARARKGRAALAGRGQIHQGAQAQRIFRPRDRRRRHYRPGRHVQFGDAVVAAARPRRCLRRNRGADLLPQRHLPDDRRRSRRFRHRQKGDPHGRGGPARIHRAGAEHHSPPPRHPDQDQRQGCAADGGRIHAAGRHQRHQSLSRAACEKSARQFAAASRRFQPSLPIPK